MSRCIVVLLFAVTLLGCPRGARSPSARDVAWLAVDSVATGVKIANEVCLTRAKSIAASGGDAQALELADKCSKDYDAARFALLAAAHAIDASDHSTAVCALSDATAALGFTVASLRTGGAWTPPREVETALHAAEVLSMMVEAKACMVKP